MSVNLEMHETYTHPIRPKTVIQKKIPKQRKKILAPLIFQLFYHFYSSIISCRYHQTETHTPFLHSTLKRKFKICLLMNCKQYFMQFIHVTVSLVFSASNFSLSLKAYSFKLSQIIFTNKRCLSFKV